MVEASRSPRIPTQRFHLNSGPSSFRHLLENGRIGDITDLLRACLVAQLVPERHAEALHRRLPVFWRVPDAIARIETLLQALPEGGPLAAFLAEIAGESPSDHCATGRRCRAR
jgi:hypothetical protein